VRRADELMVAGYEAGLESIPQIRRLIRSDQFFKSELSAVPEFDLH
jgi:hypothetical protein